MSTIEDEIVAILESSQRYEYTAATLTKLIDWHRARMRALGEEIAKKATVELRKMPTEIGVETLPVAEGHGRKRLRVEIGAYLDEHSLYPVAYAAVERMCGDGGQAQGGEE